MHASPENAWECGLWTCVPRRSWAPRASSHGQVIQAKTASKSRRPPMSRARLPRVCSKSSDVVPVGLGARDSLRLEAGLCLYGSDIDESTSPVEAGLSWAIQNVRRRGGLRAGGFQGGDVILAQLEAGTVRRRVGLRADGRAPVRAASRLFSDREGGLHIGSVTSGGFGPSIDAPVAMGYLPNRLAQPGTTIFAEVRGKRLPVRVATLPFIAPHHKRG